jgi:hypothetical protein
LRILDIALLDAVPGAESVLDSTLSLTSPKSVPEHDEKPGTKSVAIKATRKPSDSSDALEMEDDA